MTLLLLAFMTVAQERATAARYVVDDDEYLAALSAAADRLHRAGKLKSVNELRRKLLPKTVELKLAAPHKTPLDGPELHDRLRASTFTVGVFTRDNPEDPWTWDGATGYVLTADGVVGTCRHVIERDGDEPGEALAAAADSEGRVYPVTDVLASDPDADVCFLRIEANGLTPIPVRSGVRTGERVFCLSHPAGSHYLFTAGMVSRVLRLRELPEDLVADRVSPPKDRPVLHVNITAEFAPGSSGGPVVDAAGNLVAHVVSIADVGVPTVSTGALGEERSMLPTPSDDVAGPSVALRYCLAAEEILRLANVKAPNEADRASAPRRIDPLETLQLLSWYVAHARKLAGAAEGGGAPAALTRTAEGFDRKWQEFKRAWPKHRHRHRATLLALELDEIGAEFALPPRIAEPEAALDAVVAAPDAAEPVKAAASAKSLILQAAVVENEDDFKVWQAGLKRHAEKYSDELLELELQTLRLELAKDHAPKQLQGVIAELLKHDSEDIRRQAARTRDEVRK